MTNQEAIAILEQLESHPLEIKLAVTFPEACRKAVEALEVVEALERMLPSLCHELVIWPIDSGYQVYLRPNGNAESMTSEADTLPAAILEAAKKL